MLNEKTPAGHKLELKALIPASKLITPPLALKKSIQVDIKHRPHTFIAKYLANLYCIISE